MAAPAALLGPWLCSLCSQKESAEGRVADDAGDDAGTVLVLTDAGVCGGCCEACWVGSGERAPLLCSVYTCQVTSMQDAQVEYHCNGIALLSLADTCAPIDTCACSA
jgi:hypothetical protein